MPTNSPERIEGAAATGRDVDERKFVDLSHATAVQVATTESQRELLAAATTFKRRKGYWPTAMKLATAADIALPLVWGELKILQALGCVEWGKTVRVVRMPDGVFLRVVGPKKFTLDTERPFSSVLPRLAPLPHEPEFTRGGGPR